MHAHSPFLPVSLRASFLDHLEQWRSEMIRTAGREGEVNLSCRLLTDDSLMNTHFLVYLVTWVRRCKHHGKKGWGCTLIVAMVTKAAINVANKSCPKTGAAAC